MLEVNEQAYGLLEKYPELIDYMETSQGYISFSEEGIDQVMTNMLTRSQLRQSAYAEARVEQLEFQLEQARKEIANNVKFRKLQLKYSERDFFEDDLTAPGNRDLNSLNKQ